MRLEGQVIRVEDPEILRMLRDRGLAASQRLHAARAAHLAARQAEDAARIEMYDAEREMQSSSNAIQVAGYHDTGHLRTILGDS